MSFAKSKTKRFNDITSCAPPVGSYNPKLGQKIKGCFASNDTRFKEPKDLPPGPNTFNLSVCSVGTPARKPPRSMRKSSRSTDDIPRMVGPEIEGKPESVDTCIQTEELDIHSELAVKDCEIMELRSEMEIVMKSLHADLEAAKTNIAALEERNRALDQTNQEVMAHSEDIEDEVTQLHTVTDALRSENLGLKQEIDTMQITMQKLQIETTNIVEESKRKLVSMANQVKRQEELEQKLEVFEKNGTSSTMCAASLQEYRDALTAEVEELRHAVRQLELQHLEDTETIRSLKGEVFVHQDYHKQEQEVAADATAQVQQMTEHNKIMEKQINDLKERIQELEETENLLNNNIKAISEKYQVLEHNLDVTEKEKDALETQLDGELTATRQSLAESKAEADTYCRKNVELLQQLDTERESKENFKRKVQQLQDDLEKTQKNLTDELAEARTETENLQQLSQTQSTTISELREKQSELENTVIDIKKELTANMQQQSEEYKKHQDQLGERGVKIASLEEELLEREEKIQHLEQTMSDLEERLQTAYGELESLMDDNITEEGELEEELVQCREQIQQMESKLANQEWELTELRDKSAELADKSDNYRNELKKLEHKCTEQEDMIEVTKADLDRSKAMLNEAKQEVEVNKHQVAALKEECMNQEELFSKVELEKNEQHAELQNLREAVAKKQEKIDSLLDMSERLSQKLNEQTVSAEQIGQLQEEIKRVREEAEVKTAALKENLTKSEQETLAANDRCAQVEEELQSQLTEALERGRKIKDEYSRRIVETQKKLSKMEAEFMRYKSEREQEIATIKQTYEQEKCEMENRLRETEEEVKRVQESELEELRQEAQRWQQKYEDLQSRIEPFQEQLDAFEAERQALLGVNKDCFREIQQLGQEYAKLLGHQNHKQKIKHVLKIREERDELKQEVAKLREKEVKQIRQISKLQEKINFLEGKRRFDPSKAFKHDNDKENAVPPKTPAKEMRPFAQKHPKTPLRDGNKIK